MTKLHLHINTEEYEDVKQGYLLLKELFYKLKKKYGKSSKKG